MITYIFNYILAVITTSFIEVKTQYPKITDRTPNLTSHVIIHKASSWICKNSNRSICVISFWYKDKSTQLVTSNYATYMMLPLKQHTNRLDYIYAPRGDYTQSHTYTYAHMHARTHTHYLPTQNIRTW